MSYPPYVHRALNERYAECCVLHEPISSRQHLMVWGCICSDGQGALAFVNGNINSDKYVSILQENLLPLLDNMPLSKWKSAVFQQDNARPHSSAYTKKFIQENAINVPFWPALSPDLNIIENVWAIMKRHVRRMRPTSMKELKMAIEKAWKMTVTPSLCSRLYASMPSRLTRVLKNHGRR